MEMLRAEQVYSDKTKKTSSTFTHSRPERRGVSRMRVISEAKEKVSTEDLAERLCSPSGLRKAGKERLGRCPLPDHEDKTPSFTVNPEKNLWFCHGCLRGGDVVELARFAWGYEKHEVAMAAANLLHEFSHPIPEQPKSWYRKQERQRPVRNAIEEAWVKHYQRRLYRGFLPAIEDIADEEERRKEAEFFWDAAYRIAVLWRASIIKSRRTS
jgi:DNA primase